MGSEMCIRDSVCEFKVPALSGAYGSLRGTENPSKLTFFLLSKKHLPPPLSSAQLSEWSSKLNRLILNILIKLERSYSPYVLFDSHLWKCYFSNYSSAGHIGVFQKELLAATTETLSLLETLYLSLIHISEPTRLLSISYAVFCLKKKTPT